MKYKAELSEIVTEYTQCIQSSVFGHKEDVLTPRGSILETVGLINHVLACFMVPTYLMSIFNSSK